MSPTSAVILVVMISYDVKREHENEGTYLLGVNVCVPFAPTVMLCVAASAPPTGRRAARMVEKRIANVVPDLNKKEMRVYHCELAKV